MVEPTIVPRAAHRISRRDIDSGALKVLYQLHEHNYVAYLVGGSVRDLLLGRKPKDFDIGTSAHPHQVKKLFRNCWIIGRRFRLAHVKFGTKTIEVATFRRLVEPNELTPEIEAAAPPADAAALADGPSESPNGNHRRYTPNDRASSTATTPTARPRKTRSAAISRSMRSSTTSARSRSSITSGGSRTWIAA